LVVYFERTIRLLQQTLAAFKQRLKTGEEGLMVPANDIKLSENGEEILDLIAGLAEAKGRPFDVEEDQKMSGKPRIGR